MKEDLEAAARYRQHAEELRVIAESIADQKTKLALLEMASDYERMAAARENIDQAERERRRYSKM